MPTKRATTTQDKLNNADVAIMGLRIPEALNFGTIFIMNSSTSLIAFLFGTAMRFVVFPSAAIYGLTIAALHWYKFHLMRKDKKASKEAKRISFLQALWETLNSFGTTGCVITGIVGFFTGAAVGMGISITFTFFLGMSTLICGLYAGFFGYKAYKAKQALDKLPKEAATDKDHPDHKTYVDTQNTYKLMRKITAINVAFFFIVGALTTGVAVAMVASILTAGAAIGVIGCLAAAGFTAYLLYDHFKNRKNAKKAAHDKKHDGDKIPLLGHEEKPTPSNTHQFVGRKLQRRASTNDPALDAEKEIVPLIPPPVKRRGSFSSSRQFAHAATSSAGSIDVTATGLRKRQPTRVSH